MKKLFKVIITVIFWQLLFFLTVLFIPSQFYTYWGVGFVVFFIIITAISIKIIPSKKDEKLFLEILENQKEIEKMEYDVKTQSMMLEFQCPACDNKNSYWTFLDDNKCNKCGSELWSSAVKKYGDEYVNVLKKREKIMGFYNKLKPRIKRKLKKIKISSFLK